MPYREKTAWLSLLAMLAAFVPYFTIAAAGPQTGQMPDLHQLALFAAAVTLQVVILAAGHAYLRIASRDDDVVPPDERDREIERRAITWAYYVLISGMIIVGFVLPFTARGWEIVNAALLVIVAAEAVHYGSIGLSYRRQA
ncbi:MAG TPA: hypothetical protein VIG51_13385 [Candidatus Baltobacteraceae bacterium]|jgi:uncharacterized membrane protein